MIKWHCSANNGFKVSPQGSVTSWLTFKFKSLLPIAINSNLNGNLLVQLFARWLRLSPRISCDWNSLTSLFLFISLLTCCLSMEAFIKSFVSWSKCNVQLKFTIQSVMHFSSSLPSLHIGSSASFYLSVVNRLQHYLDMHCRLAHDKSEWKEKTYAQESSLRRALQNMDRQCAH